MTSVRRWRSASLNSAQRPDKGSARQRNAHRRREPPRNGLWGDVPDAKVSQNEAPDAKVSHNGAPDAKVSHNEAPDAKVSHTRPPRASARDPLVTSTCLRTWETKIECPLTAG